MKYSNECHNGNTIEARLVQKKTRLFY